jgi:hypothetical protein
MFTIKEFQTADMDEVICTEVGVVISYALVYLSNSISIARIAHQYLSECLIIGPG